MLCEKLHILPKAGGLLDQDEESIRRLLCIYQHLEDWRELQMKTQNPPDHNRD